MKDKKVIIGLSIALGVTAFTAIGFSVAYGINMSEKMKYETQLENVYEKSMYDLVESVNTAENNLSKILVSNNTDYQNKLMIEVAHNMDLAQQSISSLPIANNSIADSVKFINQVNGYMETTSKELAKGNKLSDDKKSTLSDIKDSLTEMKNNINNLILKASDDYSILKESWNMDDGSNAFTISFSKIESDDVKYPTMIYDGPFSDSQTNVNIKGLIGDEVDEKTAYNAILQVFNNVKDVEYQGEINSKIQTYNYKILTTTQNEIYAQVSKIGGNIITVSGMSGRNMDNISSSDGEKIAIDFAKQNGVENPQCVWREVLYGCAYYNIAPVQNGIILYPDLVKVKIDLGNGTVIGYDASTYFTNHANRLLGKATLKESEARKILPNDYMFGSGRLCLCPLEYSREVLCYEFEGNKNGSTYYFYINAITGEEENILKVINTTDGSKLM